MTDKVKQIIKLAQRVTTTKHLTGDAARNKPRETYTRMAANNKSPKMRWWAANKLQNLGSGVKASPEVTRAATSGPSILERTLTPSVKPPPPKPVVNKSYPGMRMPSAAEEQAMTRAPNSIANRKRRLPQRRPNPRNVVVQTPGYSGRRTGTQTLPTWNPNTIGRRSKSVNYKQEIPANVRQAIARVEANKKRTPAANVNPADLDLSTIFNGQPTAVDTRRSKAVVPTAKAPMVSGAYGAAPRSSPSLQKAVERQTQPNDEAVAGIVDSRAGGGLSPYYRQQIYDFVMNDPNLLQKLFGSS